MELNWHFGWVYLSAVLFSTSGHGLKSAPSSEMAISSTRCLCIQCHRRLLCSGPRPDLKWWKGGHGRVHKELAIHHPNTLTSNYDYSFIHQTSRGRISFVDTVIMAIFVWCGSDQFDAFKLIKVCRTREWRLLCKWRWIELDETRTCGDRKERLLDSVSTLSQAKKPHPPCSL